MPDEKAHVACPKCAEQILADALVCRFCGTGVSKEHYRPCPFCAETVLKDAALCRFCGLASPASPSRPDPAPERGTTRGRGGASSKGSYGVRAQVFEVIVRQALAGVPWREICAGPMRVNNITPEEIEEEVERRKQVVRRPMVPEKVPANLQAAAQRQDNRNIDALLDKLNDALKTVAELEKKLEQSEFEKSELEARLSQLQFRLRSGDK